MFKLHGSWVASPLTGERPFFAVWGESEGTERERTYAGPEEIIAQMSYGPDVVHPALFEHGRIIAAIPYADGARPVEMAAVKFVFSSERAFELVRMLLAFSADTAEERGIAAGDSMRFWSRCVMLALELIVKQQYVPAVHKSESISEKNSEHIGKSSTPTYMAVWEPLLESPSVHSRIKRLAEEMPLECCPIERIMSGMKSGEPGHAEKNVKHFVRTIVDAVVRLSQSDEDARQMLKTLNPRYASPLTPIEHWLAALLAPEAPLNVPALEWIANDAAEWRQRLSEAEAKRAVTTCFRLAEPQRGDEQFSGGDNSSAGWRLEFMLQAKDDPGLLFPAELIWREEEGGERDYGVKSLWHEPQERLLRDLDAAAGKFAPLERCLREAVPSACALSQEEAYLFLREGASLLQNEGFSVYVPAWWRNRGSRFGLQLRLQTPDAAIEPDARSADRSFAPGMVGFDSLVQYDWRMTMDGETLTQSELERLAELKMPLVQLRGQWVEFQPHVAKAMLDFAANNELGTMTFAEALHLSLQGNRTEGSRPLAASELTDELSLPRLPFAGVAADAQLGAWVEQLREMDAVPMLEQPAGLQGLLRPYQQKGYSWLAAMRTLGMGACLADDMGLGKSIQWIAYMLYLKETGQLRGAALLICPTSVLGNWQRELARFAPSLRVWLHYGTSRLYGEQLEEKLATCDIVMTSYSIAQRDAEQLEAIVWDVVVLDEAQNIKNIFSKQTKSIRKLRAGHRIALTGTPVENRLSELWSILDFLNPDYLGSQEQFRHKFVQPIERQRDQERARTLQRMIQPFVMRRVKTDKSVIQDLPEKQEMKEYCPLTREQVTLYEACVRSMLQSVERAEGMERRGAILSAITQLKQICNHPAHYLQDGRVSEGRSGKLIRLVEMLDEVVANGEKALIFTQYAKMAEMLQEYMAQRFGQEVYLLHGGTRKERRDEMVSRFQNDPDSPRLFVLSLKAGGYGLNLTGANHVFHYDRWWNPAVENQATDRAYRIGQQRDVQVHKFICSGTLEENIDGMIEAKKELAEHVVGTGEQWLTELSTEELKQIVTLRQELFMEGED